MEIIIKMDHDEPIKTKVSSFYGEFHPCPDQDKCYLCGKENEIQDLKLENDRLALRNYKMFQVIRSIACAPDCKYCLLRGSECNGDDMQALAIKTLKELKALPIKTKVSSLYGVVHPCPDQDKCYLCGKENEIQDLKLENDRLALRNYKMFQVIRSIACAPDCKYCLLRGSECNGDDMQALAIKTLKELKAL